MFFSQHNHHPHHPHNPPSHHPRRTAGQSADWTLNGCFHDCETTSSGASMDRVCDDLSYTITSVTDVETCVERCADYSYMGLACPTHTAFECWCCNTLDDNSLGHSGRIPNSECMGGQMTSGINSNSNGHCVGFPSGTYKNGGFYLGGHWRAMIYTKTKTICRGASPPAQPLGVDTGTVATVKGENDEYYFSDDLTLPACFAACESLRESWGCKYISSEGTDTVVGRCYVHQDCTHHDSVWQMHSEEAYMEPSFSSAETPFACCTWDLAGTDWWGCGINGVSALCAGSALVGSYKECGERAATLDMACNYNPDNGDCRCFGHENCWDDTPSNVVSNAEWRCTRAVRPRRPSHYAAYKVGAGPTECPARQGRFVLVLEHFSTRTYCPLCVFTKKVLALGSHCYAVLRGST